MLKAGSLDPSSCMLLLLMVAGRSADSLKRIQEELSDKESLWKFLSKLLIQIMKTQAAEDHRSLEMPSKLFENIVVVGLHPSFDVQMLRKCPQAKKASVCFNQAESFSRRNQLWTTGDYPTKVNLIEHNSITSLITTFLFSFQVLFAFPPEKRLPVKCRDLLSFCFPGGLEVHVIERNSSLSELNEILLEQEHLKRSDLFFVFRLQVPNSSPLYGCCVLMEELLDKPSPLISMISTSQAGSSHLERHIFTTRRCYCVLSHLPFFELHFGVLNRRCSKECIGPEVVVFQYVAVKA
ncbi:hypothetical protein Cgig2_015063 [Carnegiea gigantea]|uniref:uDENN domain-containing protein n=1 Tax=Carnegiea gigantea TaxID=171969 RepID=A0A9Q1K636_9CARY|nr:hypothetical protein Cgig2_015063 [Carnegiea gigantea]